MRKVVLPFCIAFILLLIGKNAHAQQYNEDSLVQITSTGSEAEKLQAYLQLALLYKNGNPQTSINYLQLAIEKAQQQNDEPALAKIYQQLGNSFFRLGNYPNAQNNYTEALAIQTKQNSPKGIADITAALGNVYYAQGNLPLAADNYLKALRFYEEQNDKASMVSMFNALSSIYSRQNNFSKSIEFGLKAIGYYEEASNKLNALVGYDNIGNIYLRQNNLAKAKYYFNKSLGLYTEMKNKPGVASTIFQLGNIELQSNNAENAILLYKHSLAISDELRIKPLIISNNIALGKAYTEQKLFAKAIPYFQKSIKIAIELNSKIELEDAYQSLAKLYELTKEEEKAKTFNSLSNELKDSLFNDSSLKKLTDQLLVYESEKKQQQIELLNKEHLIKESELRGEKQTSFIFTTASIILGILFLVLIIFTIQNRRIAKNLQKQQTELIEKNESILEQKEKLDQLNSVKDRFFSIISHDLRNNLTTMKLYFDLIGNKDYEPEDTSEITKQISGSVENTIDLLENLLVWASAQIKGIPIHQQKLNVHTLSQENINLLSGIAHQKNITLANNVAEDTTAYADIDMINLVLRNLITNAIKFTPDNGLVVLTTNTINNKCIVSVKDNGIGISKENLSKLFNQHEHPTTKGTANEKGTGLGLMLCKDFVERNGGEIWVESTKESGTEFFFSLPLFG